MVNYKGRSHVPDSLKKWSPDEVNATIGRLNAIGLSSLHLICHIIFKQRKSAVFFVSKMRVLRVGCIPYCILSYNFVALETIIPQPMAQV